MYLSIVELNMGNARAWQDVLDAYSMHQTLYRLLPPPKHKKEFRHLLFRVEALPTNGQVILVTQSCEPIPWEKLPEGYFHKIRKGNEPFEPQCRVGERYRFRLLAKPTKRLWLKKLPISEQSRYRKTGPRRLLRTEEEKLQWIQQKAEKNGFRVLQCVLTDFRIDLSKPGASVTSAGVTRFDGILEVTDPQAFHRALTHGIGTQKGFGLGLLTITKVPHPSPEAIQ